ncbi:MAG: glutamine amidotransferase [Hyphomicrobiaceae bacterium]
MFDWRPTARDVAPSQDDVFLSAPPRGQARRRPVLIILHQPHSVPGHIGAALRELGHALDIRRPRFGDPLPPTLARHDGAIIFGGPMSANDPDDYIKQEIAFIGVALREEAPYLGVCLGGQMLACHLGSCVGPHPDGHVEIGYHDVAPIADVHGEGRWPQRVYQWHQEGFELPAGAELIAASTGAFPNQAFRYGRTAVAIQFHPEITYAMVSRWSGHNPQRLTLPGAQPRVQQMQDHIAHGPSVRAWLKRFLDGWVAAGRRRFSD